MRLLGSVISADEAVTISGLADCIDVKNPSLGPLGAPSAQTVRKIKSVIGPDEIISAAMGDLDSVESAVKLALSLERAGAGILKIGLGDVKPDDAVSALNSIKKVISPNVKLVAAGYADARKFSFLSPFRLSAIAKEAGADGILIDTCEKKRRNLFDHLAIDSLKKIIGQAKSYNLMTALAGSLQLADAETLISISPDWAGFRSAITTSGIRGAEGVDPAKVIELREALLVSDREPSFII